MVRATSERWRARRARAAALLLLVAVVCAALGGVLGAGAASVLASTHTAQSTVLVTPLEGNPFNPTGNGDDLNNLQSEAQLAQSDAVANLVAASDLDPAAELTVQVPPNTQLLDFSYESTSREAARTGAQELASAYLKFRTSRADQAVVAQARAIQDEIDVQTDRINALARQKRGVSSAEQRAVIQQQMDGIAAQVVQLSTTLSAVTTVDRDPGQIVTKGHVVGRSPQANRLLFTIAGAVVMVGVGVGLVLVIGRRRRSRPASVDEPPTEAHRHSGDDRTAQRRNRSVAGRELAARGSVE